MAAGRVPKAERMNHSKRVRGSAAARRRKLSAPLGAAFLLLAAVGLVAVVLFSVGSVRKILDPTAKYERYARFIGPVVMMDPVPFSRVENIEQNVVPVSYTHLDVYKRQPFSCPRPRSRSDG